MTLGTTSTVRRPYTEFTRLIRASAGVETFKTAGNDELVFKNERGDRKLYLRTDIVTISSSAGIRNDLRVLAAHRL